MENNQTAGKGKLSCVYSGHPLLEVLIRSYFTVTVQTAFLPVTGF